MEDRITSLEKEAPGQIAPVSDRGFVAAKNNEQNYLEYLQKEKPEYLDVLEIIADLSDDLKGIKLLIGSPAYQIDSGSRVNTPTDCDFCFINTKENAQKITEKINSLLKQGKITDYETKYLESTETTLYHFKVNGISVDLFGQPEGVSEKVFLDLGNEERQYDTTELKLNNGKTVLVADKKALVELYLKNFFQEIESLSQEGHSVYDGFKFSDRILKLMRLLPKELVESFFSTNFNKKIFIESLTGYVGNKNIFNVNTRELVSFANKVDSIRKEFIQQTSNEGMLLVENIFDQLDKSEKMVSEMRTKVRDFKKEVKNFYSEIRLTSERSRILDPIKESFSDLEGEFDEFLIGIVKKMPDRLDSCFIPKEGDNISYRLIEDNCTNTIDEFITQNHPNIKINNLAEEKIQEIKENLSSFQSVLSMQSDFMNQEKESLGQADFASFALIEEYKKEYIGKIQKNISMIWILLGYMEKIKKEKEALVLEEQLKQSYN